MRANTDWFRDCKWGVFCHYLASNDLTAEQWNRQVDGVDVNALADQLASVGTPYVFLTLGQNSGHFCSPNATYDSYVGIKLSKCSKRDLVANLYDALHAKGIELLVYFPAGAPDRDPVAMKALEWEKGKYADCAYPNGLPADAEPDKHLASFQRKWEAIIAEWSQRWGNKVRGWWFDGCYFANAMYRHNDEPNFKSFAAAAKAGNPDSIVAFNPGVLTPIICYTEYEDYTAGEINSTLPVTRARWETPIIDGKVDGAQYHILSFLGKDWGATPPRFSKELVVSYTKFVNDHKGVVTWDVPINSQGRIPEEFVAQLKTLGNALGRK